MVGRVSNTGGGGAYQGVVTATMLLLLSWPATAQRLVSCLLGKMGIVHGGGGSGGAAYNDIKRCRLGDTNGAGPCAEFGGGDDNCVETGS